MILSPTPDLATQDIVIGLVIRKPLEIVKACLACLSAQALPPNIAIRYHVILDTDDAEVIQHCADFLAAGERNVMECEIPVQGDFSDSGPVTHEWTTPAMARVGRLKTRILKAALASHATAVWLVDADLLCDAGTLKSLWYVEAPVAFAVFWTRWHNDPQLHSAPQVWLRHPYSLDGRGYDEGSFRRRLTTRQCTQVWGGGACTLIRRSVLEAGVTFDYVPGVPLDGMMAGEDRHFNIQCESRHIPMIADPWPHIFHCYHVSDRASIGEWMTRLADVRTVGIPDPVWLNLRLRMLEPVPMGPNTFGHVPPHTIRIKVGTGQILPDLEHQCLQHLDGQPFIASVHYPSWYPLDWLRGQKRLIDVTVVDAKNALPMPVIGDEWAGPFDLTTLTLAQQDSLSGRSPDSNRPDRLPLPQGDPTRDERRPGSGDAGPPQKVRGPRTRKDGVHRPRKRKVS